MGNSGNSDNCIFNIDKGSNWNTLNNYAPHMRYSTNMMYKLLDFMPYNFYTVGFNIWHNNDLLESNQVYILSIWASHPQMCILYKYLHSKGAIAHHHLCIFQEEALNIWFRSNIFHNLYRCTIEGISSAIAERVKGETNTLKFRRIIINNFKFLLVGNFIIEILWE